MSPDSLDGPVQYTLLAVVLATVAYIRNLPYKELKDRLKASSPSKNCCGIQFQILLLDLVQILLALIGVFLLGRFQLGDRYDAYILFTLWGISILLFVLHVIVNGKSILKTLFK